jgi:ribosomal protein L11 methyltransferase PrmA
VSLIVDEHREYLSDRVRLDAFARALRDTVRPSSVVVDLGSGTGILGMLALQAGAARVHAIERSGTIEIARAVARANGVADRFHAVHAHSLDVSLPEPADVLVGDFLGRFGFNAGLFDVYPAAARTLLAPGGTLIPSEISCFVAPVETAAMDAQVRFWQTPRHGVDLTPVLEWALNTGYPATFAARELLSGPIEAGRAATREIPARGFSAGATVTIERTGTMHGLAGWFSAQLAAGVTLTNDPRAAERVGKRNVFLPIRQPMRVEAGDRVDVRVRILPMDLIVVWTVERHTRQGRTDDRQSHSTLNGMLIAREDLARGRPDFVPHLTPRGVATRTVLQLCDGRPLREIERAVYERHGTLFESAGAASAFVAELVSGFSLR